MKTKRAMCNQPANHQAKRIFWGAILILSGSLLLINNLGLLPFALPSYLFTWKTLLIVVGLSFIISGRLGGIAPLLVGVYFLLPEVLGLQWPHFHQLWPVFVIIGGLLLLIKRGDQHRWQKKKAFFNGVRENGIVEVDEKENEIKEDLMEATAIFGGESKKVSSYDFKGGKCTAIFGGLEIDLTNCYLSSERGIIEVTAVFGGVTLKVPKEWNVRSEIVPVMGAVEDKIFHMPGTYVDPAAELTLRGSVVMGGVEIIRE